MLVIILESYLMQDVFFYIHCPGFLGHIWVSPFSPLVGNKLILVFKTLIYIWVFRE